MQPAEEIAKVMRPATPTAFSMLEATFSDGTLGTRALRDPCETDEPDVADAAGILKHKDSTKSLVTSLLVHRKSSGEHR